MPPTAYDTQAISGQGEGALGSVLNYPLRRLDRVRFKLPIELGAVDGERVLVGGRSLGKDRTVDPDGPAGREAWEQQACDQRHPACPEVRVSLARLSCGLRPAYDHLQPVQSLVQSRHLAGNVPTDQGFGPSFGIVHRQHDKQGLPLQRRWKRGARQQAIGRSRGGRTTKNHAVTDATGRLIAFDLSAGQEGDIRFAIPLLSTLPAPDHQLADTAYDSDAFRAFLIGRKTVPVIRPNPTRKRVPPFDETRYKQRNVVERSFSHLKDWRRVATRYDKLARNFHSSVTLAAILIWWT